MGVVTALDHVKVNAHKVAQEIVIGIVLARTGAIVIIKTGFFIILTLFFFVKTNKFSSDINLMILKKIKEKIMKITKKMQ